MVRSVLASVAVAALAAGCYNPRYPSDTPGTEHPVQAPVTSGFGAPVVSSADTAVAPALRPGYGIVEAIAFLPQGNAAAGGTVVTARGYEVHIRMEDGTMQQVVMNEAPRFRVGDRVQVTTTTVIPR